MTTLARDAYRPVLMLGGLGYLVLLAVSLIWLHIPPEIVFLLSLGGVAVLVLAINPLIGVHAFVMLWYVEYAIPEKEGLSGMKLLGVVIVGGWLLTVALRRRLNLPRSYLLLMCLLFLIWCGISTVYSIDPGAAIGRLISFAQLLTATVMFVSVLDSAAKVRGVFWSIVVWTTLSTIVALAGYYLGITRVAVGLSGNRNILATYISIAIVCAYLLYQTTEDKAHKTVLACSLPVLFLGQALTLSRTGLIVVCMALVVVWYRVLREQGFVLMAGSVAALCVITLMLPDAFWQRAGSIRPSLEKEEGTFGTRVQLWRIGLRMIEDRPVTGVGPGNFMPAFERYARGPLLRKPKVAHNAYVSVAAEEGLVGFALFMILNLLALAHARRAIHRATRLGLRDLVILAVIVEVNLLVIMGTGLTTSSEHFKYQWSFFGLAICVKRLLDDVDKPTLRGSVIRKGE